MHILMTKAKKKIATLWFFCSGFLFLVLLLQTFSGTYGDMVKDAWSWFLPTIMPTLSLIIGVLVSDALGKGIATQNIDGFIFRLAFYISIVYLIVVSFTILLSPISTTLPLDLMKLSNIWLGPLQGLVAGILGVFFVQKEKE